MSKKVLVTGVTGQDGSYMVDYLLKNTNHRVYGTVRRVTNRNLKNIEHINNDRFALIEMDMTDNISITNVVKQIKPDYFINFAANSFVGNSWEMPVNHFETNTMGVLHCLEAIRQEQPCCRFYNAGSSEQWGDVSYTPQDEQHPFRPRSPYGASKCSANHVVKVYRESYGIYAVQGLLTNHESERRGEEFVTQKIAREVARINKEIKELRDITPIELGNLDAKRDWSHAEDFMDGVWRMLNQEKYQTHIEKEALKPGRILVPYEIKQDVEIYSKYIKDYVLSSGETHSVRDFLRAAFSAVNIHSLIFEGTGENETVSLPSGEVVVKINPDFYRPAEVEFLLGDSTKAREELQWEPKISFDKLVERMVEHQVRKYD